MAGHVDILFAWVLEGSGHIKAGNPAVAEKLVSQGAVPQE